MARRALLLLIIAASFALVACGGGSTTTAPDLPTTNGPGSGNGSGNGTASPPPSPSPSGDPCGCVTIKEKAVKDKLLGGIAVGTDNQLYATTPVGVDIFNQQLNLQPSPGPAQLIIRDTWPTVPKSGSPVGPAVAAGNTINALGALPTSSPGAAAFTTTVSVQPTPSSVPDLAQYSVVSKTWFNVTFGNFGDKWVSLTSFGSTSVFVVGDHLTSTGWVGFIQGIGISCISPSFTHPLGASSIGPDGNLWIATDPSLNSKSPSDVKTNPSILYAVNPSTGTIVHAFTLPGGSHVSAIAAGDHAVWFTDDGLNDVGFVPIGGSGFTLIPLPNHGTAQAPVSITKDSIGRMWFTEFDGKRVGYVTPATQQITLFKVTGTPIGIIGCIPGQPCPPSNVFFAEPAALGAASF